MKSYFSKACSILKGLFVPRRRRFGEKHAAVSEMEKHLVDDATRIFKHSDR